MSNPRNSLDDAIEYAAGDLPDDFEIVITVENGSVNVGLVSPAGGDDHFPVDCELGIADSICDAVDKAHEYMKSHPLTND